MSEWWTVFSLTGPSARALQESVKSRPGIGPESVSRYSTLGGTLLFPASTLLEPLIACSIFLKRAAATTAFTCGDGFQVSLKILKIVLCSDFLGFQVIHHFP